MIVLVDLPLVAVAVTVLALRRPRPQAAAWAGGLLVALAAVRFGLTLVPPAVDPLVASQAHLQAQAGAMLADRLSLLPGVSRVLVLHGPDTFVNRTRRAGLQASWPRPQLQAVDCEAPLLYGGLAWTAEEFDAAIRAAGRVDAVVSLVGLPSRDARADGWPPLLVLDALPGDQSSGWDDCPRLVGRLVPRLAAAADGLFEWAGP